MKKIVILDGYSVNPGDFSFDRLKNFAEEVVIYDRTKPEEVIERISDSDIVLTCKVVITREIIEACKNIKYIGSMATGFNHIDIEACKEKNIIVTNVPNYSTNAVSELVFAFIMDVYRNVNNHNKRVQNGEWITSKDFCFYDKGVSELYNKTIGIFGYGNIGKKVTQIAQAFDMNVLVYTRGEHKNTSNINFVSKEELFKNSDIISLHCPLTDETKGIINKDTISFMKDGVILINTGRGPLINEKDLKEGLNSKKIAYACLDVLSVEPMEADNCLFNVDNCIITPHYGWGPIETRQRLFDILVLNIESFSKGIVKNIVN